MTLNVIRCPKCKKEWRLPCLTNDISECSSKVQRCLAWRMPNAKSSAPPHSILVPITFHVCAIEPIKLALVVVSLEFSPVLINLGDCRRTSDSDYYSRRATRNWGVVKTSNKAGWVFSTQIFTGSVQRRGASKDTRGWTEV
jgi:hypothetical protein